MSRIKKGETRMLTNKLAVTMNKMLDCEGLSMTTISNITKDSARCGKYSFNFNKKNLSDEAIQNLRDDGFTVSKRVAFKILPRIVYKVSWA